MNKMDKKTTSIVAYFTFFGLIAALIWGDKKAAEFHLNYVIALYALCLLGFMPFLHCVLNAIFGIAWLYGLYNAVMGIDKGIPILSSIQFVHFAE